MKTPLKTVQEEPTAPAEVDQSPHAVLERIEHEIRKAGDEYDAAAASAAAALEAAGAKHKAAMTALLAQRSEAELLVERSVDTGVASRLATLVDEAEAMPAPGSDGIEQRRAELRARIAPDLAKAREVERALRAWNEIYREPFQALKRIDRRVWLEGQPLTGVQGERSHGFVISMEYQLNSALSLAESIGRTITEQRRQFESLIEHGVLRLGHYEFEREVNAALRDLRASNLDSIAVLHSHAKAVTGLVETIRERQREFASADVPQFENKQKTLADLARANDPMAGRPARGDDYSPFNGSR